MVVDIVAVVVAVAVVADGVGVSVGVVVATLFPLLLLLFPFHPRIRLRLKRSRSRRRARPAFSRFCFLCSVRPSHRPLTPLSLHLFIWAVPPPFFCFSDFVCRRRRLFSFFSSVPPINHPLRFFLVVFSRCFADAGGVVPELCRQRLWSGGRTAQALRVGTKQARGNPRARPGGDNEGEHTSWNRET